MIKIVFICTKPKFKELRFGNILFIVIKVNINDIKNIYVSIHILSV